MPAFDAVLDAALPYVTDSWLAVHVLLAAPFLLMLVNFLRGKCDVAEAVVGPRNPERRDDAIRRRLWMCGGTALAFAWQIHAVWFVAVPAFNLASGASSPRFASEENFQALLIFHGAGCVAFALCVAVVWARFSAERRRHHAIRTFDDYSRQRNQLNAASNVGDGDARAFLARDDYSRYSFCGECATPVRGRDHHCSWLGVVHRREHAKAVRRRDRQRRVVRDGGRGDWLRRPAAAEEVVGVGVGCRRVLDRACWLSVLDRGGCVHVARVRNPSCADAASRNQGRPGAAHEAVIDWADQGFHSK